MKVTVIDRIHPILMEILAGAGYECDDLASADKETILNALESADGIVLRSGMTIDQSFIDRYSQLKFIGRVGAGLEHIDVEYARSKGREVLSSPEGNRQAVAEHALGMLLSLFNHIPRSDLQVRNGQWIRKENEGEELDGKSVGIIGFGNTGSAFAQILSGFNLQILAYDKYKKGFGSERIQEVQMIDILQKADVVSIHLPLTDETKYLINEGWIRQFQKPIFLINTSRGPIVKTDDLLNALDDHKIKGACLDVLEYETENLKMPAITELPETARRLFDHPRVLLTPHTAGLTVQSYEKLSRILAEKIIGRFGRA